MRRVAKSAAFNDVTTSVTTSGHRSTCPMCKRGIRVGDRVTFIKRPVTGTVHVECVPEGES